MIGAPRRAIQPAVRAACSKGGRPTGMWLLTSAVSSPSNDTSMAAAVNRLCEKKKLLSRVKKPKKKMTNASRRARISSVFNASNTTIKVTPASRPNRVRKLSSVAAMASSNRPISHQREGSGSERTAITPRQKSNSPVMMLHHTGRFSTWGATVQAITTSRNRVSRASRGKD